MRLLLVILCCVMVCGAEKLHNLRYYELVNVQTEALDAPEDEARTDTESHPYKRRLKFDGHGRKFDVHLKRSDVIPEKLNVITQNHDDVGNSYHFQDHAVENCYYHGRSGVDEDAPVVGSGSMCNDEGFRGTLTHEDGEQFNIRPLEKEDLVDAEKRTPGTHVVYNSKDILVKNDAHGTHEAIHKPEDKTHKPLISTANKPNVTNNSSKIYGRNDSRYIEVFPIVTYEIYVKMDRDLEKVIKKVIEWIHEADTSYKWLDKKTHMVLVGLMVWDKGNEANHDIWNMPGYVEKIMSDKLGLHFDTVPTLFYGGSWWGQAWLGTVCGKNSASVCSVGSFSGIGGLIYHETLHSLGIDEHEMGGKVIKDNFYKLVDRNAFPCLYKRIAKDFEKNTCGNGVKEAGEVCDCVSEYECKKRGEFECCDPKTCQLRPNMQCMDGGCCEKCKFKRSGASCKAADKCLSLSSSTCSGTSEHCPAASPAMPARKIGCYRLKYHARAHGLFNGERRFHKDEDEHMKGVLCQCARAAREAGREYFAMYEKYKCQAVRKEDLLSNYETQKKEVQVPQTTKGNHTVVQLRLINAKQSTTHTSSGCAGEGTCAADKACDGDLKTIAVTHVSHPATWWLAQFSNRSKIENISISTNSWAFNLGFFNRLKIETAEDIDGPWITCKGEFEMKAPFVDHQIQCNRPTAANYIKVAVYGGKPLYLNEVKVTGYHFAGKIKIHKKPCNGIDNDCCTDESPCVEGDGDCDGDSQCEGNLVCGVDNCPKRPWPFDGSDDCCTKGYCYLASKTNKDKLICNKPKYMNNKPEVCTSAYWPIKFVYKVDIPNIKRCPAKKSYEIGAELPTKKGCYKLKKTSSPSLLVDNSVFYRAGHKPGDWSVLIKKLLCECAEAAKKRGGKLIGLLGNKCWMINETDLGIESNDILGTKKTWRNDGTCGGAAECDPNASADGKGPCCSSLGWCGNSIRHCDCSGCKDYGPPKCYLADGWWPWWNKNGWYQYQCSSKNLHNDSPHPCVGDKKSYFVYQI